MAKLWAGRTDGSTDSLADDFNSSIPFDCRMYRQDITGSMAHAAMLGAAGIIGSDNAEALVDGLQGILDDLDSGKLQFDLKCEDIREHFGRLAGIKLVYMGDARYNMGNSLMVGCAKMGMHLVTCAPEGYFQDPALVAQCQAIAAETGAVLEFDSDPMSATKNADVIYTDVWVSMGEPEEVWADRIAKLSPYQVNEKLMENAGAQCRFMHCLPAFHDLETETGREIQKKFGIDCMEVTHGVFEGPQSIVFDEAENRMHTIKAVIAATLV